MLAPIALALVACASRVPRGASPPPSRATTRYRVGDYVVYRYSGAFSREPVMLREQVIAADGNRLTIAVDARRGLEHRRWEQVVTDTPEYERNNVVDALFEIDDSGARVRLANRENADVYRLYDWTYIVPEGHAIDVRTSRRAIEFARTTFECEVTTGSNVWRGSFVSFRVTECPSFLWTHGPAEFTRAAQPQDTVPAATGGSPEVVYRAEVVEFGNRGVGEM